MKSGRKPVIRPQVETILLANSGMRNTEIAHAVNCYPSYVSNIRADLGIPSRIAEVEAQGTGISCPECGSVTSVVDSRPTNFRGDPSIRRRRKCLACDFRFSTYEVTDFGIDIPSVALAERNARSIAAIAAIIQEMGKENAT